MCVAGGALQRRVQHLGHFRPALHPERQGAGTCIVGAVTQVDAGQGAQHGFGVVGTHTQAQAHMGEFDAVVQRLVAGDDAAHQHIAAATRVFGECLY